MTRKKRKTGRGKSPPRAARPKSQKPVDSAIRENGKGEEPITAFSETQGSVWPTPDSLDDQTIGADQSGVENIQADAARRRRRGTRMRND